METNSKPADEAQARSTISRGNGTSVKLRCLVLPAPHLRPLLSSLGMLQLLPAQKLDLLGGI